MKRVVAVSKNEYLLRKIELTLVSFASVTLASEYPMGHFDVCLWDSDTLGDAPAGDKIYVMSSESGADIQLPFEFCELTELVNRTRSAAALVCRDRCAYLRGEAIKLTELEAALLSRLISAGGEFVSRAEILCDVWGEDVDSGIINVYIHYLREKLERGEKIIISSRSLGYKIDGRYL